MPEQPVESPEGYAESFPASLAGRLPILVRLREFWSYLPQRPGCREITRAQLEASLAAWLASVKPGGLEWADVDSHLDRGSALFLLDGVDEVPLSRDEGKKASCPRAMLLSGLAEAIGPWAERGNRVLVTSRPYGIEESDARKLGVRSAGIEDLDEALQGLLVRRWFHLLTDDDSEADASAAEMSAHLHERPDLAGLTANPMLLTAICIVYGEGKRLPQDRAELYARIVENVLHNRYPDDPVGIAAVRNRLSVVAHGMHTGAGLGERRSTPQAAATYDEIDRMLQAYMDERSYKEKGFVSGVEAREDLLTRTGLLLPREGNRAGFYHLSFQEFLAAERIGDLEEERLFEVFVTRAGFAEWQNTLSFLFGSRLTKSTSPERSIGLLERLVEKVGPGDLGLSVVVADCFRILLGREIRLRDDFEEKFRGICLGAIQRDVAPRSRLQLGLVLGHLGDPRIVTDLRDRAAYVEIPSGTYLVGDARRTFRLTVGFRIARYPVTNSQYRLFLDDGGYGSPKWWSSDGLDWLRKDGSRPPWFWRDGRWNVPNQPVVGVSFWEAEAFCKWAGGRLPDEYEWEAAARGPEGLKYPWGDDWEDGICNSSVTGFGTTSPVGIFPRSRSKPFGLEEMAGNVWEWCGSFYDPAQQQPGSKRARVLRGGSWDNYRGDVRSAGRIGVHPVSRYGDVGFRVVL